MHICVNIDYKSRIMNLTELCCAFFSSCVTLFVTETHRKYKRILDKNLLNLD